MKRQDCLFRAFLLWEWVWCILKRMLCGGLLMFSAFQAMSEESDSKKRKADEVESASNKRANVDLDENVVMKDDSGINPDYLKIYYDRIFPVSSMYARGTQAPSANIQYTYTYTCTYTCTYTHVTHMSHTHVTHTHSHTHIHTYCIHTQTHGLYA